MHLSEQTAWLFLLALPIASIAWTVTHEDIFKEPREFCIRKSKTARSLLQRKFFYLFTCEYCFSHYISAAFLIITRYHLLLADWRGYIIGGFALVWISNVYMSLFGFIKVGMRRESTDIEIEENKLPDLKKTLGKD